MELREGSMKSVIKKIIRRLVLAAVPEILPLRTKQLNLHPLISDIRNSEIDKKVKLYPSYKIFNSTIREYTYIAQNSYISNTHIGKFCSIGPDFKSGWGIHPTNGISTSPMFYSVMKQNGFTLSKENKIEERKNIYIGNDVFIGRNVVVLDGVKIGDGAIIGAGAVVSKDIPDFAIAVGVPIKIVKYRFTEQQRTILKKIKWWDFDFENLQDVEKYFFDIDSFLTKYSK